MMTIKIKLLLGNSLWTGWFPSVHSTKEKAVRDQPLTSTLVESQTVNRQRYQRVRQSSMRKTFHGSKAVREVIRKYGRQITQEMVPVIEWEGFSHGTYTDTKGIETSGVGQTGIYADLDFPTVFYQKKAELLKYTPSLSSLPDEVQDALLVANYRGDWAGSPKTRAFFTEGMYEEAAEEYLNNAEYKNEATPKQIKERFEWVAETIRSMATGKAKA